MTRPEKILVVDDNTDNVDLLSKRFSALGYEVSAAFDGEEGLAAVATDPPDLIILDIMMPRLDGFEVCRRLKLDPQTRLIPIIMLTAKRELPDKIKGLDTGADDYVTKPFNPRELVARAKGLLQRCSSALRAAAEEKLGALGQMAEGVAHEVRNPMVTIGGFARRIYDRLPDGDPLKDYAQHIIKEVERLENMVEEIVKFKTLIISPYQEIHIDLLMGEVFNEWEPILQKAGIDGVLQPVGEIRPFMGDWDNIVLATSNLVQNAMEAIDGTGRIVISYGETRGDAHHIFISVQDDGRGIAKADLPNIYDPFFTTKMSGAGMGLTLVHRIVSRHGGVVDVVSEEGRGTTVTMNFPIVQEKSI